MKDTTIDDIIDDVMPEGTILDDWESPSKGFHNGKKRLHSGSDRRKQTRLLRQMAIDHLGGCCSNPDCPHPFDPYWGTDALEFDHIKRVGPDGKRRADFVMYRMILANEATNIQLLCANCHNIKSRKNRDYNSEETQNE